MWGKIWEKIPRGEKRRKRFVLLALANTSSSPIHMGTVPSGRLKFKGIAIHP